MNIKLKALLIALGYVAIPFVFIYIAVMYPLVILFSAVALIVFMVYLKVLDDLKQEKYRKHGYSVKEFDEEFGGPK